MTTDKNIFKHISWRMILVVILFATASYLLRNCEQSCPYSESGHKNNSLEFSDK